MAALDGWEITPVENDGALVVVTLTKGPELHFQSFGRPIPRRIVRSIVQQIIDRHGYVTVKTPKIEPRQQRFNRAIGFRQVGEDEYDVHFRMDKFGIVNRQKQTKTDKNGQMPVQGSAPCP